ncbi:MAG TPA: hypothetical protein IAA75_03455 [Candidatus Pullichristensenella avicola]|nr:hypothetical protein [Candidatus Pullichristensenella avicola]
MKNLLLLMRLNRLELFGINRRLNDPARRASATLLAALIALGALAALALVYFYCWGVAYALQFVGALSAFPVLLAAIAAAMALVTTIIKAPDALFRTRDLDMLLSLPLPARTVATARVLKLYGMNLLFTMLIMLPGGVAYGVLARPGAAFYVRYALCALAAPMIPAVLASLIGVLVAMAGAAMKRLRYAGLALMFVALIGVVAGSTYLSFSAANVNVFMDFARALSDLAARVYPLAPLYADAVLNGEVLSLLVYVGVSLLTILLAGALFGRVFVRLNSFLSAQTRKKRFVLGAQTRRSPRRALLAREWRHFLSINSYVLNSAFGPILSLLAVVALAVFVPGETIALFLQTEGLGDAPLAALPFVLSWLIGIGPTTACAVSLEGKSLWIVKSLPVPARAWLMPKLRLNLQLVTPFAIADSLVLAWVFRARGAALAVLLLMPALMGVFSALVGLIINCKFPRFDWTNEAKIAKNGSGALAAVLISMALCFGGLFLTFRLPAQNAMLIPAAFTLALALACVGLYLLVRARAETWVAAMH